MRRWEYRTVVQSAYRDIAEELNTLGDDGWELVSICASGRGSNVLVLKRPRAEFEQIAAASLESSSCPILVPLSRVQGTWPKLSPVRAGRE